MLDSIKRFAAALFMLLALTACNLGPYTSQRPFMPGMASSSERREASAQRDYSSLAEAYSYGQYGQSGIGIGVGLRASPQTRFMLLNPSGHGNCSSHYETVTYEQLNTVQTRAPANSVIMVFDAGDGVFGSCGRVSQSRIVTVLYAGEQKTAVVVFPGSAGRTTFACPFADRPCDLQAALFQVEHLSNGQTVYTPVTNLRNIVAIPLNQGTFPVDGSRMEFTSLLLPP